ncbi:hypothetical protein [Curtobacterium sp. MCJR17_020]|uniref:hypothetical protein n=1 Tax=Curtobacterium sp. MCJR17_020 TaxID=2175619 RepID=UPI0011B84540|nr:hypothetical protein [Curtobacterium sp. MCJR17_020]WIE71767.1 hypothetical protein DEJ14_016540 [Curtobacterium sp. MCJR17_020]
MFGRLKHSDFDPVKAPAWSTEGVQAQLSAIPLSRGRSRRVIEITCAAGVASFAVSDIHALLAKQRLVVESVTEEPLLYFCWPEGADPKSAAAPVMKGIDGDSVVLVEESESTDPVATLTGSSKESFADWFEAFGERE